MSNAGLSSHLPEFSSTTARISHAYEKGTLYRKEIVEGELKSKEGMDLAGAYLGHAIKWLSGGLQKENDQLMMEMFNSCKTHFETIEAKQEETSPDPINAKPIKTSSLFDLKITEKFLRKLHSAQKIDKTEQQSIEKALEQERKNLATDNAPPKIRALIQDSRWKAMGSRKELSNLSNKLTQKNPRLSNEEKRLLKDCLLLNNMCVEARIAAAEDPSHKGWINEKELNAIQNISHQFAVKATKAHQEFEKKYGKVASENGKPAPTPEQVQGALEMAKKHLSIYRENCDKPELETIYARAFQVILFGPEGIQHLSDPTGGNYLKLLERSDFKQNQLDALKTKLQDNPSNLSPEEVTLMKHTLWVAENFEKEAELVQKHPELGSFCTVQIGLATMARETIEKAFLDKAVLLHKDYQAQHGPVEIEGRTPIATAAQLKGAFALAAENFPSLMENRSQEPMRQLAGRVIQTILCGEKTPDEVEPAKNDYSFIVKELRDRQNQNAIPMQLQPGESFLSHHINTQEKSIPTALNHFFSEKRVIPKDIHDKPLNVFSEDPDLLALTHQTENWETFRTSLRENVEKGITKEELKQPILKWVNEAKEGDLKELQTEIRQKSVKKYLENFLKDIVDRSEKVSLNHVDYKITDDKGVEDFFSAYRTLYFERLLEEPARIQEAITNNKHHEETAGIPHNLSGETFHTWLKESAIQKGVGTIDKLTQFTPEQLQQLADKSGLSEQEIEPLLRIKVLQMMISTNQSIQGIDASHLDATKIPLPVILSAGQSIHLSTFERQLTISSDLEGVSTEIPNRLNVISDHARREGTLIPEDHQESFYTMGSLRKNISIPSLTAWEKDKIHTAAKLSEYQDFAIGPDLIDKLDSLMELVSPRES